MALNPYLLDGPAIISFSGGRTSGLMLWKILDAHGGVLPNDVKVAFQNTGREDERTLEFVRDCSENWGVHIHWLEYFRKTFAPITEDGRTISCHGYLEVSFNTASRNGEPFKALIDVYADFRRVAKEKPAVLPNPVQRFCSGVLKQRVMHWWVQDRHGWDDYAVALGLRADEPGRVSDMKGAYKAINPVAPLSEAGVTRADVMEFWRRQSFDLGLADDPTLGTYEGNCDFCFLKSSDKIRRLSAERPASVGWWADRERETGQRFRKDRFSMIDVHEGRVPLPSVDGPEESRDIATCFCTD